MCVELINNSMGEFERELLEKRKNACELCGDIQRPVLLHYVDGNQSNKTPKNVVLLCEYCNYSVTRWDKTYSNWFFGLLHLVRH